jgi:hypothetical protein
MAKRKLREEWIERVVGNPSRIEPDEVDATLEHRLAAVARACQPRATGYRIQRRTQARHHRASGPQNERQIMKLTIDREADALYLDLDEAPATESEEISPGVILDYNAQGKVVGIEML